MPNGSVPRTRHRRSTVRRGVQTVVVTTLLLAAVAGAGLAAAEVTESWSHTEHTSDPTATLVHNDLVISGDSNGEVLAYDPETETVAWRTDTAATASILGLVEIDGTIVAAGRNGAVVGLNPNDGVETWSLQYNEAFSIAAADDVAYVGLGDGAAALTPTGEELWQRSIYDTDAYGAAQGIDATPDTLYLGIEPGAGETNGAVIAYDPSTDTTETLHTQHEGNVRDVLEHEGVVYSAGGLDDARVIAFDPDAEATLFSHEAHTDVAHNLAVQQGHLFSVGGGGELVQTDLQTRESEAIATPHTHTFDVTLTDGIAYTVAGTAGSDGTVVATNTALGPDPAPNVRVTDGAGEPVSDATVEWYGVVTADSPDVDTMAEAEALLDEAANPEPGAWEPDRSLAGSNGLFANADAEYVAVHSAGAWGFDGPTDFNDLSEPVLTPDAEHDLVITTWDPAGEGLIQDDVDRHLPGETVERAVEVQHLAPGDESVETQVYEPEPIYEFGPGVAGLGNQHYGIDLSIPGRFYRISPVDSRVTNEVMVGGPVAMIRQNLRDEADDPRRRDCNII